MPNYTEYSLAPSFAPSEDYSAWGISYEPAISPQQMAQRSWPHYLHDDSGYLPMADHTGANALHGMIQHPLPPVNNAPSFSTPGAYTNSVYSGVKRWRLRADSMTPHQIPGGAAEAAVAAGGVVKSYKARGTGKERKKEKKEKKEKREKKGKKGKETKEKKGKKEEKEKEEKEKEEKEEKEKEEKEKNGENEEREKQVVSSIFFLKEKERRKKRPAWLTRINLTTENA